MSLFRDKHGLRCLSARDIRAMRERVLAMDFSVGGNDDDPPKPPERNENMNPYRDDHPVQPSASSVVLSAVLAVLFIVIVIIGLMFGLPTYNVWKAELQGKAEFVRAEQNRQIMIEAAKANLEAEKLNAQAEIERAKGAAQAIEIEGGKITDAYLRYLWIRQLKSDNNTLIYIPTEAGLPILEAGKRPFVQSTTKEAKQ